VHVEAWFTTTGVVHEIVVLVLRRLIVTAKDVLVLGLWVVSVEEGV
jgi:hypothetical protein